MRLRHFVQGGAGELSRGAQADARAIAGKVARVQDGLLTHDRDDETLWIDIETLLPRGFELTCSMFGFGDAAFFDLTFEK